MGIRQYRPLGNYIPSFHSTRLDRKWYITVCFGGHEKSYADMFFATWQSEVWSVIFKSAKVKQTNSYWLMHDMMVIIIIKIALRFVSVLNKLLNVKIVGIQF